MPASTRSAANGARSSGMVLRAGARRRGVCALSFFNVRQAKRREHARCKRRRLSAAVHQAGKQDKGSRNASEMHATVRGIRRQPPKRCVRRFIKLRHAFTNVRAISLDTPEVMPNEPDDPVMAMNLLFTGLRRNGRLGAKTSGHLVAAAQGAVDSG